MRAVRRGPAPACLATDTPEAEATHRRRYDDLRYPSGGIRPLWNDLAKDERGVGAVRRALLTMTDGECAYCGLLVGNDHMQVDHTEELLEHFAKVSSHPSLFRRFVAYWREERDAGRLAPAAPRT